MSAAETFLEQLKRAATLGTNFGTFAAPNAREAALHAVNKVQTVMALPDVTARILNAVEDPNTSAAQLHRLVSQDPSLITRMLTVVNSALFGFPGKVDSIERAVVILGLRGVKNLAIAAGMGQVFRGGYSVEGCTPKNIWKHSIAVAVAARELARELNVPIAEEVFIAGLVHDLGMLVAMQVFPQQLQAVCLEAKTTSSDFCQLERSIIGTDHQWLGEALAARWRFPRCCQVVANHHHSPLSAASQDRLPVILVYVADTICCRANHGFSLTGLHQTLGQECLAEAKLDTTTIERVTQKLPELLSAAAHLVG